MRETLPSFFGFEAVGILMYSFENDSFFTDLASTEEIKENAKKEKDQDSEDPDEEIDGEDLGG